MKLYNQLKSEIIKNWQEMKKDRSLMLKNLSKALFLFSAISFIFNFGYFIFFLFSGLAINEKAKKFIIEKLNKKNFSNKKYIGIMLSIAFLGFIFSGDSDDVNKNVTKEKVTASSSEKKQKEVEINRADDPLYVDKTPAKKPVANTTYKAILTCGFNGMHTNILACFERTDLKLTNNGQTGIYKIYNISQLGNERSDGFHITLSNSFNLTAQNSHDTLTLGIKVYDNNNREVYQDMVGMWGVIKIGN